MSQQVGLLSPLQRDGKTDFAHGSGAALTMARVRQVFQTAGPSPLGPGELPWNTDFGCSLHLLRHAKRDAATEALARAYVEEAFDRWLADLSLNGVRVEFAPRTIKIFVSFSDAHGPHNLDLHLGDAVDSTS